MINLLWTAMIAAGILFALTGGQNVAAAVTKGVIDGAESAVRFAFGLVGILAFWSGLMKIAEDAGITKALGKLLAPLIRLLFPQIPKDHPASASIVMSIIANMLGIGQAATPLGLKAMEDLKSLSSDDNTASDAMCTFVVLCTSSVTLIPGTVIAIRASVGSVDPTAIVGPTLVATLSSTFVALVLDRIMRGRGTDRR